MKLVAHASPLCLEAELLDRIAAEKQADPLAPVLVVVPSRRLADHLEGRLAGRFGAVLGVSVLHHGVLAARILEQSGAAPRRVLGDDLLATLFDDVVHRTPAGPVRDFVRDHPQAAAAMLKALTDLREAGVAPAIATELLSGHEAQTAQLYERWAAALEELEVRALAVDDAGLVRAALPRATEFARSFAAIFHYGAYDLIGLRVQLVRELDRGRESTFLVAADPADSSAFGIRRASAVAGGTASTIPDCAAPPAVSFLHAQGARAELKTAVYEALAAVSASARPGEIAIVVRSFRPYVAALDELFDRGEVAWHTSYTRPLLRDVSSSKGMRAIAAGADSGRKRFSEHAAEFEQLASDAGAALPLAGLLQSMRDVEELLGDRRLVGRGEAHAWLTSRAAAAQVAPKDADGGGIRILDVMQARGLTFSHVHLIGMNAGLFPRVAREHPFLSDRSKARLAEAVGSSLPIAAERDGEEKLLLAMTLRSARLRLGVSWQRADEEARPVTPSLALAEIARFAGIGSTAGEAVRAARSIPAHPRARLQAWADAAGVLDPRDERTLAALSSELGANAGPAVVSRVPEWSAGVALVAATESFEPITGVYDGRIGRSVLRGPIAATALERLAWCPMRFFFGDVLGVDDLRRDLGPFESDPRETGIRVHDALSKVYRRLRDEGAFGTADLRGRIARAREILREAWTAGAGEASATRAARVPVLDRIESDAWLTTLDAFLQADLTRMAELRAIPELTEDTVQGVIPGDPSGIGVKARVDRIVTGPDGRIVGDYKTGGAELSDRLKATAMLSGASLQAPIYTLLTSSPVELLGVGPKNLGQVARLDGLPSDVANGVLETIDAALSLASSGRFPIHADEHCERCAYRSACRHGHPPTVYRESLADDVEDSRDCWSKTGKLTSLDAVRRARP